MKGGLFFCCLVLMFFIGCAPSSHDRKVNESEIKGKYNFKPLSNTVVPEELKAELRIPFYKEGKYYFSDYDGAILNSKEWDGLKILGRDDLFWGQTDSTWSLYIYPNTLVIDRAFTDFEFKRLEFKYETTQFEDLGLRSVTLEKIALIPSYEMSSDFNKPATKEPTEGQKVKEVYYFSKTSSLPISQSFISAEEYKFKKRIKEIFGKPYFNTLNFDFEYCLLDMSGEMLFRGYTSASPLTDNNVALINSSGLMALANVETKEVYEYKFNGIRTTSYCTNTFLAWVINADESRQYYRLDSNGDYEKIEKESDIKCTPKAKESNLDAGLEEKVVLFQEGKKYGVKTRNGKILLPANLNKRPAILHDIEWICINERPKYGVMDFSGEWIFPLENRQVFYAGPSASHKYTFELNENGYRCIFNEKMELLFEKPSVFIPIEKFDPMSIDEAYRPDVLKKPILYQEYSGFSDGTYGHIYTAQGKYISSHKGKYNADVSLLGLPRREAFKFNFVPIGMFNYDGVDYYVRLWDGMEYRD